MAEKVLVEVGHIYMDQAKDEVWFDALELYKRKYLKFDAIVMLDDLNIKEQRYDSDYYIRDFENIKLVHVGYESDMVSRACEIFEQLKSVARREFFRKENKDVWFIETTSGKTPIASETRGGEVKFPCQMLSLCWALFKLNHWSDFRDYEGQIVIIDKRYKEVEEFVARALKEHFQMNNVIYNIFI